MMPGIVFSRPALSWIGAKVFATEPCADLVECHCFPSRHQRLEEGVAGVLIDLDADLRAQLVR